jgi:beta-glucosidase
MIDRRTFFVGAGAAVAAALAGRSEVTRAASVGRATGAFPADFLWGAATAGHQVEGNNTASDIWFLENVKPTVFMEPSGDACNSFLLWSRDLDLVKSLGLNSYRFSIEWARIEPEPGQYSIAMLDHYKRMIDGCRERGLTPVVTFNHFVAPRWFAAMGGWTNPKAPELFEKYCARAAGHLAGGIGWALTFNEPNLMRVLKLILPPPVKEAQRAMLAAAAHALNSEKFATANDVIDEDMDAITRGLLEGHRRGRAAIKSVRPDLPVGVSLSMFDDQAVGKKSRRDAARQELYGAWLEAVKQDDFLAVQNYERVRWDANGRLPAPAGATLNSSGVEVYAPSLAGAVRYAHQATGLPIVVTEHGVSTDDDTIRAAFIPAALAELKKVMDEGVPVRGYLHWSLLDNFEWIFGYKPKLGLCSVDRKTFERTPKPSASVLAAIAQRNAL